MNGLAVLLVGAGGAAGAVLRHLAEVAGSRARGPVPWATLAVNVVGSFVLGVVVGAGSVPVADSRVALLVGVGFCGGLTTFSGVSLQVVELGGPRGGRSLAASYAVATPVLAVLAATLGHLLGSA